MASITYKTQVGAGATVENALQNTVLERVTDWGFITGIGRQEATSGGEILTTVFRNSEEVVTESTMTINDELNPNAQDDVVFEPIPVKPGDYVRVKLRESTGNATDLRLRLSHQPADARVVMAAAGGRV